MPASRSSSAWIFVSHSSKDLEKVRRIRNAIEIAGAEPILFFLKCLSDHDELDQLLKREIDARNFFLLCDSANARASRWVQDEVAHVRSLVGRKIEVIDLDGDWPLQLERVRRLVRGATVFLSHVGLDAGLVGRVERELVKRDFQVWRAETTLTSADEWASSVRAGIEGAVRDGFFLHFVSRRSLQSPWVQSEADLALELGGGERYIPILLDAPSEIGHLMPPPVRFRQSIDFSDHNVRSLMPKLLLALGLGQLR